MSLWSQAWAVWFRAFPPQPLLMCEDCQKRPAKQVLPDGESVAHLCDECSCLWIGAPTEAVQWSNLGMQGK